MGGGTQDGADGGGYVERFCQPGWPPHAIEGSPGAAIIPELEVRQGDYTIRKRTYNAFFATDLDLLLWDLAIERLVICGTVSNICVLNTAGDAAFWGYRVVIPQDAICALNEFDQQAALRQASFLYQAKIVNSKDITPSLCAEERGKGQAGVTPS